MVLTELKEGSVITFSSESFNKVFLGFKCRQSGLSPYCTTLVTIKNYFLVNPKLRVIPICDSLEYLADDPNFFQKISLMNPNDCLEKSVDSLKPGTIIKLTNSLAITTKYTNYNGLVCCFIGDIINIPNESLFHYLGTCADYNGILDYSKSLRVCPNCNSLSLQQAVYETPSFNTTCECLVCRNIIAINWKKD